MHARHLILTAILSCAAATASLAQEMYFGGGLAYTAGTSKSSDGDQADLRAGIATLVIGQRFASGNGFWGWETSADLSFGAETSHFIEGVSCSNVAYGPYLCKHDATLRVVGIYGAPVSDGIEFFGSFGVGIVTGDFAVDITAAEPATTYGLTAGLGLGRDFGNGMSIRGELIYDHFNRDTQPAGYDSDFTGTTFRVTVLRKF